MPLNGGLMKGAWFLQKNFAVLIVLAGAAGIWWKTSKPMSEDDRLAYLLEPEHFNAQNLKRVVDEATADQAAKDLVKTAIDAADHDKALVDLALTQVRQIIGRP